MRRSIARVALIATLTACGTSSTSSPPPDAGADAASCGAANFVVVCASGGTCPTQSRCSSPGRCTCADDTVALDCSGQACGAVVNCLYPNWWCLPRTPGPCGARNFTVPCNDGDGGIYHCPTNGTCLTNRRCGCAAGHSAIDCSGQPCSGACSYPNWWCN